MLSWMTNIEGLHGGRSGEEGHPVSCMITTWRRERVRLLQPAGLSKQPVSCEAG